QQGCLLTAHLPDPRLQDGPLFELPLDQRLALCRLPLAAALGFLVILPAYLPVFPGEAVPEAAQALGQPCRARPCFVVPFALLANIEIGARLAVMLRHLRPVGGKLVCAIF